MADEAYILIEGSVRLEPGSHDGDYDDDTTSSELEVDARHSSSCCQTSEGSATDVTLVEKHGMLGAEALTPHSLRATSARTLAVCRLLVLSSSLLARLRADYAEHVHAFAESIPRSTRATHDADRPRVTGGEPMQQSSWRRERRTSGARAARTRRFRAARQAVRRAVQHQHSPPQQQHSPQQQQVRRAVLRHGYIYRWRTSERSVHRPRWEISMAVALFYSVSTLPRGSHASAT